jgi:carbonic anhydrase
MDFKRIRSRPLVPGHISIYGYYDVRSGRLVEVPEATAAGKATA